MRLPFRCIPLLFLLLAGCATVEGPREPHDPYEAYNRAMYRFNDRLDRAVLKPVAEFYDEVVPAAVNTAITNFFSNIDDVMVVINDLLQAKFLQAGSDLGRIAFNTTVGLFGLFDVATHLDLPKHDEDFGQTLGYWGVGPGPYVVLPVLGPSTVRDTAGLAGDWYLDPVWGSVEGEDAYWGLVTLRGVDKRAELLSASRLLEQAALDPYVFHREAYLQMRRNRVHDGRPPQEELDIFEEFDPTAPDDAPAEGDGGLPPEEPGVPSPETPDAPAAEGNAQPGS